MILLLPCLALAPTLPTMAAALLVFRASLGLIEIGMNVHAVEVEKRAGCPLMSGFHGLFSVGAFAGSLSLTAVLSAKLSPIIGTVAASGLMLAALIVAVPRLVATRKQRTLHCL